MTADLRALLARLEVAAGPDAELNGDLWWAFDRPRAEKTFLTVSVGFHRPLPDTMPPGLGRTAVQTRAPRFTESIDAAVALVERRLPGWGHTIGRPLNPPQSITPEVSGWYATVFRSRRDGEDYLTTMFHYARARALDPDYRYAPNGAIAIITAMLRAELAGALA